MVKLKKKTEKKYIFSIVFMEEKGLFLREKIKLLLYSMFINIGHMMNWSILPNCLLNIGHI